MTTVADTTAAPIEGTPDDEFDTLIENATMRRKPVRLSLDGELRGEYELVKDRIAQRAAKRDAARTAAAAAALTGGGDTRLGTKTPEAPPADERDPEQDHLDELVEKMRAKAPTIIVQGMSSTEYNRLLQAHPPRKDPTTGRVDPRDYDGYNSATFPPALVRASIVKPTMTDARWAKLDAKLDDTQFDKLYNAAAQVNRRDEDIPF
ncbi:hypothetical protein AB0A95_30660 [Micromonospora sp. NPDC049230]|uniref:hypothetical protein n=1 Tax=Micromonospora sp. NPDC049230 TaxID=3155502 RepID=UPI0033FF83E8